MKLREWIRTGKTAQLVVAFVLLGLSSANAAGSVFNIAGFLNDRSSFSGTLTIDTTTVSSNSAILASKISVNGNTVETCRAPQFDSGAAGSDSHPGTIGAASGDASRTPHP